MNIPTKNERQVSVNIKRKHAEITMHADPKNTLTREFLNDFHRCLDDIESNPEATLVSIVSENTEFCIGMDFEEFISSGDDDYISDSYLNLLNRLSQIDRITVSVIGGPVLAGGMGIVATSDVVIANDKATFSLPEILWGLIPSVVLPFLIRKIGFSSAYRMTLLGGVMDVEEAYVKGVVDIYTEDIGIELRKLRIKSERLDRKSILDTKRYFRSLLDNPAEKESIAIDNLKYTLTKKEVKSNIRNYVVEGRFPWQ